MKRKIILSLVIVAFVIGAVWYYAPMSFSSLMQGKPSISITYTHLGVKDGQPINECEDFNDLSSEQINDIINRLSKYSYKRKWNTPFSDGSLSDVSDLLYININEENNFLGVTIANDNQCVIAKDGVKNYTVKNADSLIKEILDIIK